MVHVCDPPSTGDSDVTPAARALPMPTATARAAALGAALMLLALMTWLAAPARAQDGVAVGGYDPVAYFTEGRAVPGENGIALKWRGRMWRFANAANRNAFEMNPHAYAPQFGGFCTLALSEGRIEPGTPTEFVIHDGRLYLVHDPGRREMLAQGAALRIERAAARWPDLRKTVARR
jgi:hypothetical protein